MQVVLLLGGNMGDRLYYLATAAVLLEKQLGPVVQRSAIYQTAAWGKKDQADFYNQVIICETEKSVAELMPLILAIEAQLGRKRSAKWDERTIDIDVLLIGDLIISTADLEVPHPRMQERRFVLMPLAQLLPDFLHPVLEKSIKDLLLSCPDLLPVKQLS